MNRVDWALAVVLVACAARGYWRGFLREGFGLLALIGGVAAALQFTAAGEVVVRQHVALPPPLDAGVAFVVIFAVVHILLNVAGVIVDHLAGVRLTRGVNRLVGAAFGAGKAAAVLGFVLLFFHLFPIVPELDGHIMASTIGRPLVTVASDVIRLDVQDAARPDEPRHA